MSEFFNKAMMNPLTLAGLGVASGKDLSDALTEAAATTQAYENNQRVMAEQDRQRQLAASLPSVVSQIDFSDRRRAMQDMLSRGVPAGTATTLIEGLAPQSTPLSSIGKLQADIAAGRIPEDVGAQALQREISPRSPLVNVSTGTQETAREKALGQGRGQGRVKFENDIDAAATSGVNLLNTMPILRQSLEASGEGGAAKSTEVMVKGLFNQFGANVDEEKLANEQTFNAEVKRLITPTIKALGSNPSNADRQFIADSFAGLDKSKKTNEKLLNIQEAVAIKALEKQRIKDANLDLPDSDVKKMLREYDSENPLSDLVARVEAERKAAQTPSLDQLKQKYGLE